MSSSKSVLGLCLLLLLCFQFGCDTSAEKVKEIRTRYEKMKIASGEFVEIISSVKDEESAQAVLPKLEATCERMYESGKSLEEVANTTLRSAAGLKQEMENFRLEQKKKVDEQIARIAEIPKAAEILEPTLKKYGFFGSQTLVPF